MFGIDPVSASTAYILAGMMACPAAPAPVVDLQLIQSPPPILQDMGYHDMSTWMETRRDPAVRDALTASVVGENVQWLTMGFAEGKLGARYKIQYGTLVLSDNSTCLYMAGLHFELTYKPVIHIASDLLNKACTYNVILAHEQSHVAADLLSIADYFPTLKSSLTRYVSTIGTLGPYQTDNDVTAEEALLTKAIEYAFLPTWNALTELRRQRQAAIDTPENYRATHALCPGPWLPVEAGAPNPN